jgi:hypothetical protein
MKDELDQLEKEESRLLKELLANREKQKQIYADDFIKKYRADIGDTIQWKDVEKVSQGVVSDIVCFEVTPYGYLVKKSILDVGQLVSGKRIDTIVVIRDYKTEKM